MLYSIRALDNQVKTLSDRKADNEGCIADIISYVFFRVAMAIYFQRQGESQEKSSKKLLENVTSYAGNTTLQGTIIATDCGYGSFNQIKQH